jgi:Mlc titration factor MtfA (ptsG expression regulator)
MRHYLIDVFDKIIIYPQPYFSTITQEYHKGEFNPEWNFVFSWKNFQEGFSNENDNLNLDYTSFRIACIFMDWRAGIIVVSFLRMPIKNAKIFNWNRCFKPSCKFWLFQVYAYTNQVEFLAVIFEHFFETPKLLKVPELYNYVREMINFDETIL